MLSINNKEDLPLMLNYHRTKDMINLLKFFPDISPVRNLTIVSSLDDYNENYLLCKDFPCMRNDTLVTKPMMKSVEIKGFDIDIKDVFTKVKELDNDGVLVLFDVINEPSERYDRYAGISVGVSVANGVYIDAVGRGFDGREVTKGISVHERFYIPWFSLRDCNIRNFKDYRTYIINQNDYLKSRDDRINFLLSVGLPLDKIVEHVPEEYTEIPDFIWLDVIKNILKKLEDMEEELISYDLREFAISGHTEGKRFMPWQMFDKSRYILK